MYISDCSHSQVLLTRLPKDIFFLVKTKRMKDLFYSAATVKWNI